MEKSKSGFAVYDGKLRRISEEMVQAEARHIAKRRTEGLDCDCKDGMFPSRAPASRREFLFVAGSGAGAAAAPMLSVPAAAPPSATGALPFDVPQEPAKEPRPAGAA